MVDQLVHFMTGLMEGLPAELITFVISMIPILELRGGMIAAALFGLPLGKALAICIIGNVLPIPFILLLIRKIFVLLKRFDRVRPLIEKLENRVLSKSDKVKQYEFWGLMIFVGIPLPGTGGWTGALIAALLNIKIPKAFLAILLGICMAAAIMCFITYLLPYLLTLLDW